MGLAEWSEAGAHGLTSTARTTAFAPLGAAPQFEASGMTAAKGSLWIVFDNLHRWAAAGLRAEGVAGVAGEGWREGQP